MILKDPYTAKHNKYEITSGQIACINRYIVSDYAYVKGKERVRIKPFVGDGVTLTPVILYGLTDSEKEVHSFSYPIFNPTNKWIALDLRNSVVRSAGGYDYDVRNESEYKLSIQRFILTGLWYVGDTRGLYSLKLPHFAFANWISENIGRKFGLSMGDQLQIRILALIYYSTLFTDHYEEEEELDKLAVRAQGDLALPSLIKEVFDKVQGGVDGINTIDAFCKACYDVTNNVRLKGFDYTVLTTILSNTWMSDGGRGLVLLSLQHPPTWISLVHASLTSRNFNKTVIATTVERMNKRGKGDEFLSSLANIVKNCLEE